MYAMESRLSQNRALAALCGSERTPAQIKRAADEALDLVMVNLALVAVPAEPGVTANAIAEEKTWAAQNDACCPHQYVRAFSRRPLLVGA